MSSLWGCWSARSKKRRPRHGLPDRGSALLDKGAVRHACELAIVDNSALQHSLARET